MATHREVGDETMSSNALLPRVGASFGTHDQTQEIIDGETWIQLPDGRWGIFRPSKPRTGPCMYCGHAMGDSCFRPDETLEVHESRCSALSLCPATRSVWCDRDRYFGPDQRWGATKKTALAKVAGYFGLPRTKAELVQSLRIEADRNVRLSRLRE
jgi:hypothetical protein